MAMPVIRGLKTQAEKFAGAVKSYCIEAMMQNGLALQAGTSHELGQNFAKAFEIRFQNQSGQLEHVWQTSWGVSTRLIGALVMSHSDDRGLVLPPRLAPTQVVFIPIYRKDEERSLVVERTNLLAEDLKKSGVAAEVDARDGYTPGHKFFHWEQRGIPVLVEIGPREVQSDSVVIRRRDAEGKQPSPSSGLSETIRGVLDSMQRELLQKARQRMQDNTVRADSFQEIEEILGGVTAEKGGGKFIAAHLKDDPKCDAKLKEIKASVRCIPLVDVYDGPGKCILTGEPVAQRVIIAKAY
jgi:prolyl-tRNA synthetase